MNFSEQMALIRGIAALLTKCEIDNFITAANNDLNFPKELIEKFVTSVEFFTAKNLHKIS
jgi:hypothetical protein